MDIKEKVYNILKEILGEDATGIYCYDSCIEEDCESGFYSSIEMENGKATGFNFEIEDTYDIEVRHGASRLVLIPEDEDFIIKLPITTTYEKKWVLKRITENEKEEYTTCWSSEYDYYDIQQDYLADGWKIESEEMAIIKRLKEDCDLMDEENVLYEDANPALKKILLPNNFIGKWNNCIPVYVQKKIKSSLCDSERKTFSAQTKKYFDLIDAGLKMECSKDFIMACIDAYGFSDTTEICEGIIDLGLTDLHGGNIGFLPNDNPCIFDYAGYDEDLIWDYICY